MLQTTLWKLLTINTVISLICILLYWHGCFFSFHVVFYHMILVIGLYAFYVFFGLILVSLSNSKFIQYFLVIIPANILCVLLLLYLLNFISFKEWGESISWKIVWSLMDDLPTIINSIPYNITPIIVSCLIVLGGTITMHIRLRKRIYADFIILRRKIIDTFLLHKLKSLLPISALCIGALTIFNNINIIKAYLQHKREPIYNFLKPVALSFDLSSKSLAAYSQNNQARENYLSTIKQFPIPQDNKKNIIIFIIDALRADHLPIYGYSRNVSPYLMQLEQENKLQKVNFANSNCATSFCGISSILSSKHINILSYNNYKIHDALKDLNYKNHFFLSGSHKDWYSLDNAYKFYNSIDVYAEADDSKKYELSNDLCLLEFIEQLTPFEKQQPAFMYFHLMSVHAAGVKFSEFNKFQPAGPTSYFSPDSLLMVNNYDNSIMQADYIIEQIMQELAQKGYLENVLVIFTADHGEALGKDGRFGHGSDVYHDRINIPILFYDSEEDKREDLFFASQIDIAPTIFDKLNFPIPTIWDGHSLIKDKSIRHSFHRQNQNYAILQKKDKLIFKYIYKENKQKHFLFDLTNDLEERNNLIDEVDYKAIKRQLWNKLNGQFELEQSLD